MANWKNSAEINLDVVYFNYKTGYDFSQYSEVYVWDLDKTYLDTSIDSLKGLLATIFEKSMTKKNVPGTSELLKSIASTRKKHFTESDFPLFFVSASPPQMESKIYEKFALDGISPLGMFYKDNLKNLTPSRLLFLKKQIGYKVQALMQLRCHLSPDVRMICFGDDSESDVIIYNLFSDICARRHTPMQLENLLEDLGVSDPQIAEIIKLQSLVEVQDPVEKIYINLATDTDPDYYNKFGRRTLATYDAFQVALDLVQDQRLSLEELGLVMESLVSKYGYSNTQLIKSFEDLIRRRVIGLSSYEMIKNYLIEKKKLSLSWSSKTEPLKEKIVENGHVYQLHGL
ncbi:MAG: phosphatase domain-containing protein, partial [Pseudobdellovibrio sp.]